MGGLYFSRRWFYGEITEPPLNLGADITTPLQYDSNGDLNSTQAGTNYTWQFTVDASGSRTYHSPSGYLIYGADGRIAKYKPWLTIENNAVNYVYNSASQRVLKSGYWHYESGDYKFQKEHTLYADADEYSVMGTYSNVRSSQSAATENATDSTEVIYLPTASGLMPVATEINGRLYAINTDHLNTPRRLTDSEGRVAWQWILAGYGEAMPTTGWYGYNQIHRNYWGPPSISFTPPVVFNLRYPGQQWDPESGLVYNINRYYDVSSGRYIQADPIGLGGGWNRFTYVEGNPLSWADPDGLSPRGLPRKPIELMPLEGGGGGMAGGGDFLVGILDPANLSRYTDQTLPTTLKAHRLIREKLQSLKIVNLFMADLYPMIRIHQEIGGGRQMMGNTTDLVIPTMVQLIFQEVFHQIAI